MHNSLEHKLRGGGIFATETYANIHTVPVRLQFCRVVAVICANAFFAHLVVALVYDDGPDTNAHVHVLKLGAVMYLLCLLLAVAKHQFIVKSLTVRAYCTVDMLSRAANKCASKCAFTFTQHIYAARL